MKFPELVIKEAKALRKYATPEEINNLDFNSFAPDDDHRCIYGQMTGHCFSTRAGVLKEMSCERVYNRRIIPQYTLESDLNGTPVGLNRYDYWSPIEVFIASKKDGQYEANEKLIQFIKGEIKSL